MQFINFIKSLPPRFNWRVNWLTVVEILLILSIYPLLCLANPQWFMEDGLIENLQLVVLLGGAMVAFGAKNEHKLFVVVGFFLLFLITRETNMGRSYFCAHYLAADEVCKWSKFRYAYLVDVFRIIYVLAVGVYFIKNKLWQPLVKYIKDAPLYMWDIAVLLLMAFVGTISEFKSVDNEMLEEACEFICYVALVNCVWRYMQWQQKD